MCDCVPKFNDYKKCTPTKSCYLDGRYFNKVFDKYPGLVREPLTIKLSEMGYSAQMPYVPINNEYDGLLRVVIETPSARHETLIILDTKKNVAYWFNSFPSPNDEMIRTIISKYIGCPVMILPDHAPMVKNSNCDQSGFCTAYSMKYAHDYLHDQPCDLRQIKSFASAVEQKYPLYGGKPDVCYGWFNENPRALPTLVGAGVGGLAGGALTGGFGGALLGSGIGALGGYTLSGPGGIF